MKPAAVPFLFTIVASVVCSSYATPVASPHIVGGTPWESPTRPEVFELNLYKDEKFKRTCKAAVLATGVSTRWITAAECLDTQKYDEVEVKYNFLGEFKTVKFLLSGKNHHVHPDYNSITRENNIGIVNLLLDYVDKDSSLRRIELPREGEQFEGKEANIFLDYKNTTKNGDEKQSVAVKAVQTKIISNNWCAFWYRWSPNKNNNICASGWYLKGLRTNDVGIPLVVKENDETFKLVGIATEVRPWAHFFGLPIEFLNVEQYHDWIRSV